MIDSQGMPYRSTLYYNTIQYKFINMAAISWIKRKTITHKQRYA